MPKRVDALELHRKAMAAQVSIAPGPMFSASRGFASFVRINCGHPLTTRVEAALQKVGRAALRMAK